MSEYPGQQSYLQQLHCELGPRIPAWECAAIRGGEVRTTDSSDEDHFDDFTCNSRRVRTPESPSELRDVTMPTKNQMNVTDSTEIHDFEVHIDVDNDDAGGLLASVSSADDGSLRGHIQAPNAELERGQFSEDEQWRPTASPQPEQDTPGANEPIDLFASVAQLPPLSSMVRLPRFAGALVYRTFYQRESKTRCLEQWDQYVSRELQPQSTFESIMQRSARGGHYEDTEYQLETHESSRQKTSVKNSKRVGRMPGRPRKRPYAD